VSIGSGFGSGTAHCGSKRSGKSGYRRSEPPRAEWMVIAAIFSRNRFWAYSVNTHRGTDVIRLVVATMVSAVVGLGLQISANPPGGNLASVQGQVTDASGHPLRKAGVTLRAAGDGPQSRSPYTGVTDADGRYSFNGIAPGGYTLEVERAGYLRKLYRATPHETFSTITVAAGQHLNPINMALTRAVAISGGVLDEDGDPVANVRVQLLRTYDSAHIPGGGPAVFTDESGNYRIPDLSAGRYYLSAGGDRGPVFSILGGRAVNTPVASVPPTRPGYYGTTFYPGETDQSLAKPIQIVAGQNDLQGMNIQLQKRPAFQVTGKIVGEPAGCPIEKCQVLLASVGAISAMGLGVRGTVAHIAKDGSLDFPGRFQPGDYFFRVMSGLPGRQIVLASQRLTIRDRDINAVLNLQPLVEVRGNVAIEGAPKTDFSKLPGAPPPSVTMQIFLYSPDNPEQSGLRSNITNDGSFTIGDVAPGIYEVRVCCIPGGTWVKSIQFGSQDARDNRIEIPGGTTPGQLQIMLSRSVAQIAGIVETDQGKPADGGAVTLIGDSLGSGKVSMMTGIARDGRFTLPQIAPGTYRLYAWDDLETAQHYDPDFLKSWESHSTLITVGESAGKEVTLKQIPAAAEPQ
jgi:protocatechuate 3,4-dioxygenase beta subunit